MPRIADLAVTRHARGIEFHLDFDVRGGDLQSASQAGGEIGRGFGRGIQEPIAPITVAREDLEQTVKEVEALDRRIVAVQSDVRDRAALRGVLDAGLAQLGHLDIVVATGGTGISPMDVTIDAARPLFDRELSAFGVMFTVLSHAEVGMACLLSRATAGVMKDKIVFCLPGSPKACKLAMEKIILPEAGHIVKHAREPKR